MSKKKKLLDANVIIKLHQNSLWKSVIHSGQIAITPIIRREVKFYRDKLGEKKPINLSEDIASKKIEEIEVSLETFTSLPMFLKDSILDGIDDGEREAIAFLHANKRKETYLFCTADQLAIKCLGVLGLSHFGISLQELLDSIKIKSHFLHKDVTYCKTHFDKMLSEGFGERHLHKK